MNWIDELLEELDDVQDCRDTFQYLVWDNDVCKYDIDHHWEEHLLKLLAEPMSKQTMIDELKELELRKNTYIDPMRLNQSDRAKWIENFCR
jgi:hypothetical protein